MAEQGKRVEKKRKKEVLQSDLGGEDGARIGDLATNIAIGNATGAAIKGLDIAVDAVLDELEEASSVKECKEQSDDLEGMLYWP